MKDTRKLSLIYFMISLVMLLFVCFGCDNRQELGIGGEIRSHQEIASEDIIQEDKIQDYFIKWIDDRGRDMVICGDENYVCEVTFPIEIIKNDTKRTITIRKTEYGKDNKAQYEYTLSKFAVVEDYEVIYQ